jgi:hypothetical protein
MKNIVNVIQQCGYNLCVVYLIDALMVTDVSRFFAGTMMCLSAMVQMELPHVNLLSKCDLMGKIQKDSKLEELSGNSSKSDDVHSAMDNPEGYPTILEQFLDPDVGDLLQRMNERTPKKYKKLNAALGELITDYSMVSFLPLDVTDTDSVALCMLHIDRAIQFGEEEEPMDPDVAAAEEAKSNQ